MKRSLITAVAIAGLLGLGTIAVADHHKGPHGKMGEKFTQLLEKFDSNDDGMLDETERESARLAKFTEIDADGNGSLTEDEIVAHLSAKMLERVNRHFAEHDTDGSGEISVEEFETAHVGRMEMRRAHREERRAQFIERFDTDGDGELSEAERAAAREAGFGRRGKRSQGD